MPSDEEFKTEVRSKLSNIEALLVGSVESGNDKSVVSRIRNCEMRLDSNDRDKKSSDKRMWAIVSAIATIISGIASGVFGLFR